MNEPLLESIKIRTNGILIKMCTLGPKENFEQKIFYKRKKAALKNVL